MFKKNCTIGVGWLPLSPAPNVVKKVLYSLFSQVLPAIHLESPLETHVIKKRSLDQQLRIKLYYDESVYRYNLNHSPKHTDQNKSRGFQIILYFIVYIQCCVGCAAVDDIVV